MSLTPVTMRRPSGENAALRTFRPRRRGRPSLWPERTASCAPLAASQMRAVRSLEAVTMPPPVGRERDAADAIVMAGRDLEAICTGRWPHPRMRAVDPVGWIDAMTMRCPSGE